MNDTGLWTGENRASFAFSFFCVAMAEMGRLNNTKKGRLKEYD